VKTIFGDEGEPAFLALMETFQAKINGQAGKYYFCNVKLISLGQRSRYFWRIAN
jgi:hypothetical protein